MSTTSTPTLGRSFNEGRSYGGRQYVVQRKRIIQILPNLQIFAQHYVYQQLLLLIWGSALVSSQNHVTFHRYLFLCPGINYSCQSIWDQCGNRTVMQCYNIGLLLCFRILGWRLTYLWINLRLFCFWYLFQCWLVVVTVTD